MSAAWLFFRGLASAISGLASIVPGWVWAAVCAGSLMHGCVLEHQRDTARRDLSGLKAQVMEQETTRAEVARLAEAGRRAAEKTHSAEMDAINRRTADEKTRLDAAVAAALAGLQQRPDRPAARGGPVPGNTATDVACTGAQLFRADAAFLVREAARADQLRISDEDCRAKYDAGVTLTGGWEAYRQAISNTLRPNSSSPLNLPKGTP